MEQTTCKHTEWEWQEFDGVDFMVCEECGETIGTTCPSCGGEGIVEEDEFENDWINFGNDLITCPECQGEGWVKQRTWW